MNKPAENKPAEIIAAATTADQMQRLVNWMRATGNEDQWFHFSSGTNGTPRATLLSMSVFRKLFAGRQAIKSLRHGAWYYTLLLDGIEFECSESYTPPDRNPEPQQVTL
jgi:hypothetical protein